MLGWGFDIECHLYSIQLFFEYIAPNTDHNPRPRSRLARTVFSGVNEKFVLFDNFVVD